MEAKINNRIAILFIILVILFLYLGGRLFYLQVFKHQEYSQKAQKQRSYNLELEGPRGKIFDRNGLPLAMSQESVSLYAIPQEFTEKAYGSIPSLSTLTGLSQERLVQQFKSHRSFFWIKRQLPLSRLEEIKGIKTPGIGWVKEEKRVYPQQAMAGQVLGFTGVDSQGLEGLEKYYDAHLKGTSGKAVFEYDAKGQEIFSERRLLKEPEPGSDLYLTVDLYLQHIAEKELKTALAKSGAQRGAVIIMDPATGEILANAIGPEFDPNRFGSYPAQIRKNWVATDLYEPGSTFKIFTMASALQEGVVTPGSTVQDDGFMTVADRVLKNFDSYDKIHGLITMSDVLRLSSNIGAAQVGLMIGKDHFRKYLVGFGFGTKTGIDFPGENPGLIPPLKQWSKVVQSNISFGQGVAVTPLELLCATAAVANGGKKVRPHFLKKGDRTLPPPKEKTETVPIKPWVLQEITSMMIQVVEKGTGKAAALDHYSVAGKTGTAQKAEPGKSGYMSNHYVVSFVGFFPAESPKLAILVVIDEPQAPYQQGGMLAAPVFKAVAEQSARHLNIPPSKLN